MTSGTTFRTIGRSTGRCPLSHTTKLKGQPREVGPAAIQDSSSRMTCQIVNLMKVIMTSKCGEYLSLPLASLFMYLYPTSPDCRITSLFSFLVRTTTGCQIVNHTKVVINYNSNNDSQDSLTVHFSVGDDYFVDANDVCQTHGEPRVILLVRQTTLVLRGPSSSVHGPL